MLGSYPFAEEPATPEPDEPAPPAPPEEPRSASFGQTESGSWRLSAELPPDEGALAARDELFGAGGEGEPAPRTLPNMPLTANRVSWADAFVAMAERSLDAGAAQRPHSERHLVLLHVGAEGEGTTAGAHLHLGSGLSEGLRRFVSCDARIRPVFEAGGKAVSVGRAFRSVPERTRIVIEERDRGCRVPGCDLSRWLHVHHIEHWEDGGTTDTPNLLALCRKHHRLHHLGHLGIGATPTIPTASCSPTTGATASTAAGGPCPAPSGGDRGRRPRHRGRGVIAPHRRAPRAQGGLVPRAGGLRLPQVLGEIGSRHSWYERRPASPRRSRPCWPRAKRASSCVTVGSIWAGVVANCSVCA